MDKFDAMDKKKAGKLKEKQFLLVLKNFKLKIPTSHQKELMSYIDINEDGFVQKKYFEEILIEQF